MKKFAIVLVSLAVILVVLDRVGVVVANVALEGALRDRLHLDRNPKVRVHGIPFLTQVVGGTYKDMEVDASGLDAGKLTNVDATVHLHDVQVPISDLGRWDFSSIPIGHAQATVTVPYNSLVTAAGLGSVTLKASGDALDVSGPVTVAGHTIDVTARARPKVSGDELQLNPEQGGAAGVEVPGPYLQALRRSVPLTNLPFGLKVTSVDVTPDGLRATGTVDDVTIRDGELVPSA